jgi:hypothetical protein
MLVFSAEAETGQQIHINLRTISSNVTHPHAAVSILRHYAQFTISNAFIQIVDDVVGTFLWASGPRVIIWNWKTGNLLVVSVITRPLARLPLYLF